MLWLVVGSACASPNRGLQSVTTPDISDGAVTSVKIARHAVGQDQLAPGAVTTTAVAFGAIGSTQLGRNSVGPEQLQPHSVTDVALADGVVVRSKLGRGAVGSGQIAPAAVKSAQLSAGAVLAVHLAPGSVQPAAMSALFVGLLAAVAGLSLLAIGMSGFTLYVAARHAEGGRTLSRGSATAHHPHQPHHPPPAWPPGAGRALEAHRWAGLSGPAAQPAPAAGPQWLAVERP